MEDVIKSYKKLSDPNENFPMYNIGVTFESGKKGLAFAKNFPPPYEAGQLVEVTENGQTAKGTTKYKIQKVSGGRPAYTPKSNENAVQSHSGGFKGASSNQNGMRNGMIVNNAVQLLIASKSSISTDNLLTMIDIVKYGADYVDAGFQHDGKDEAKQGRPVESESVDVDDNEDLPF